MKKVFTVVLTLVMLCPLLNAFSANSTGESKSDPGKKSVKTGVLVMKVKPEFKSFCFNDHVNLPAIKNAMTEISAHRISRKFPNSPAPVEKYNRYGDRLVDITLIYEIHFSPVVLLDEALQLFRSTGLVEYAEPLYIHDMYFTPNDPDIGQQYALGKIQAYAAWDVWTGDTNIVIGIVDSGSDWDHPDLQGNIKYNYADPIDGVDNDADGFVDNFRGWDVSNNDNSPMNVSSNHGAHVSGCAAATTNNSTGVAAPAFNCKFLPVKASKDQSVATIDNGYDGIVYAADHGAHVINCSWGSSFMSQFEKDIIDYATFNKNSTVIAAAGNGGVEETHYPASYENVVSVASTQNTDVRSGFSSYHSTVDVSAPGSNIYSTVFNNSYTSMGGTSMASPIAAGCAAMIKSRFPALNARQVAEQLRTTCDNIYQQSGNFAFYGKLGKGRVNLYDAVTDSLSPGVIVKSSEITDSNDGVYVANDTLSIVCLFENLLRPTTNLTCTMTTNSPDVQILQGVFNAGVLATFDTVSNYNAAYKVLVNSTAPLNSKVTLRVTLSDGSWSDIFTLVVVVNVDYINIAINNVATSITSKSLIGYNQEQQVQGLGFTFNGGTTILYDMGLMVGAQGTQVSDNVRNASGYDADFKSFQNVYALEPGVISEFDVYGIFKDNNTAGTSANPMGITVSHRAFAWTTPADQNYVMVQYYIRNDGTAALNNLYAGLFADWDIMDYSHNKASTDNANRMGYIWNTDSAGIWAGIKLLSHSGGFVHNAIDNTAGNSGIEMTDGFDNTEKYTAMSTNRSDAGTASTVGNDVLSSVATGPFNLAVGDSVEVAFALIAGTDLASIQASADAAQVKYDATFTGITTIGSAVRNELFQSYPNPSDKISTIEFSIKEGNMTEMVIFNILGEKVKDVISEKLQTGHYSINVDVSSLPAGKYFVRLTSGSFMKTLPLSVAH